ncbi:TonB-dependent receptor plug domain-containing protein [Corallibacter sp.]|uniref:TonB-dependent receptor plug domain-containing protein n=1 Tax=Corallibacter sp. TaxID=2038084 RepID=UPI003AB56191
MSLNKNKILIYFTFFFCSLAFSQVKEKDSSKTEQLNEVVVTGQYNPQSIKKSVHNVIVIKREQIENQAANNLADLLNFNLNLTVIGNSQTGKSSVELFGLDGQYFSVLIDNVPVVSDQGLGNNIDLTQINLDDVERIEIVEGAMGVEYGANAFSGVINIITKKNIETDWKIQAIVQEETASDEYSWFEEGKHIQGLNIGHNFNEKWFARVGVNRNQFAGFYNNREGKDYYINDGARGYEWLPKTQITSSAMVNYNAENFKLNYRFEYFNEDLRFYNQEVRPNIDIQSQTSNPSATDRIYKTNRFVNNLNLNGILKSGMDYSASFSYQKQKRGLNEFNYYIITKDKNRETDEVYQSTEAYFSKGTVSNLIKSKKFNVQMGYEGIHTVGFDTQATGAYSGGARTNKLTNLALFASPEYNFTDAFSIRPGVRYEYNSKYHSNITASLSSRYLMRHGFELRVNVGSAYRTPNFQELYLYFVDSNHDVRGNENLDPESGYTAFVNLKKTSWFNDSNASLVNNIKLSYVNLDDKIENVIINTLPLQYQYLNIDKYKLIAFTSENSFKTNNWNFHLGGTFQGRSRTYSKEVNNDDSFLFSYQLNARTTYHFEKIGMHVSALFKYQGSIDRYAATGETDDLGNNLFAKETIDGYGWLDASVKKSFFNKSLIATIGARNLLDITNVDVSNVNSGAIHSTGNQSLLLGYGRSYYLKLVYNLNF